MLRGERRLESLARPLAQLDRRVLGSKRRSRHTIAARERRQELVDPVSQELGVRQDVDEIVPLVFGRRYRVAQFGGRMSERRVDDPPLPFS